MTFNIVIHAGDFTVDEKLTGIGYRIVDIAWALAEQGQQVAIITKSENAFPHPNIDCFRSEDEAHSVNNDTTHHLIIPSVEIEVVQGLSEAGKKILLDYNMTPVESLGFQTMTKLSEEEARKEYDRSLEYYRTLLSLSDYFIVGSKVEQDILFGQLIILGLIRELDFASFAQKVISLPQGFSSLSSADEFLEDLHHNKKWLWNGGVWNHYSPDKLLSAFEQVASQKSDADCPHLHFMYRNNTSAFESLVSTVAERNMCGYVQYPESREHNPDHQSKADVFKSARGVILLYDNMAMVNVFMPLRIREIFLHGLPVIVSDYGIFADFVKSNSIGMVVSEDELSISRAIDKLTYDDEFYRTCRENLRKVRTQFEYSSHLENFLPVLK